ncbi:MAG: hypothetical protein WD229_09725, partial [Pirellulales bacterium]
AGADDALDAGMRSPHPFVAPTSSYNCCANSSIRRVIKSLVIISRTLAMLLISAATGVVAIR